MFFMQIYLKAIQLLLPSKYDLVVLFFKSHVHNQLTPYDCQKIIQSHFVVIIIGFVQYLDFYTIKEDLTLALAWGIGRSV